MRRAVAIKVLQQQRRLNPQAIARFEREIQATSELTHPNTVRIFDSGVTEDGLWYYVMELLDGENLTELVARCGPLPHSRAIFLARQAARALSEAHQRGIIHRDVKPDNLFVTCVGGEHDFVKVLDFGIARLLADDWSLTGAGFVGTPGYIAPEVLQGAEAIPAELDAIVVRCLAPDPNARFGTTRELIEAIDACVELPAWTEAEAALETSNVPAFSAMSRTV